MCVKVIFQLITCGMSHTAHSGAVSTAMGSVAGQFY